MLSDEKATVTSILLSGGCLVTVVVVVVDGVDVVVEMVVVGVVVVDGVDVVVEMVVVGLVVVDVVAGSVELVVVSVDEEVAELFIKMVKVVGEVEECSVVGSAQSPSQH